MPRAILGISAFYHDSAACLISDGRIVAAAQEERFTRKKHDSAFPRRAVAYCLEAGRLRPQDLTAAVFYEKPWLKFDRLLETFLWFAPKGFRAFRAAMRSWLGNKLFLERQIRRELEAIGGASGDEGSPPVLFTGHHEAHAASAYYPSGIHAAGVLCMDGVGEWTTTSGWAGNFGDLRLLWEIPFPHSLGLLYSAFTYHAGFQVNSGEYKLMGLAPYGRPTYAQEIYDNLIDVKADGSFRLNLDYFDYCVGSEMTNERFSRAFGGQPRTPESPLTQRDLDLARSVQDVTEEITLRLARTIREETGIRNLCMAGGVALNCVANGRLLREGGFDKIWVQPAAGDAGGALGAALAAWRRLCGRQTQSSGEDLMEGALLGPQFSTGEASRFLTGVGARFTSMQEDALLDATVDALAAGKVVGWFQGRMEFGPRALGARSILADPRDPRMHSVLNRKIKFRESFRPFAPAVIRERVAEYFGFEGESRYMEFVAYLKPERRRDVDVCGMAPMDRLALPRSDVPAVTHVDYSARLQTVCEKIHPRFYRLLRRFESRTGCAVLVNTSFNVRGEPIVCTPEDAYRCFMRTGMEVLAIENCILYKSEQTVLGDEGWNEFPLD